MLETRKARRYKCNETVDIQVWGGQTIVYLKDFSMTGARLQGTEIPPVGTLIRVSPSFGQKDKEWVMGQICWTRQGVGVVEAGVRFLDPLRSLQLSWVGRFVKGKDSAERRCAVRVPTQVYMELKIPGERALEATSVDLSRAGAQIELPFAAQAKGLARLNLCLPWCMIEVPAQVLPRAAQQTYHSLRFLGLSRGDEEALVHYLKDEIAASAPTPSEGSSWLELLNGR